jgi:hypothetical protein
MDRLKEVQTRRVEVAMEAELRWQSTKMAPGTAQADIAKEGPLRAESPARAQQFQLRESMGTTVQTIQGRRRNVPGQERTIGATLDTRDLPSDQNAEIAGDPGVGLVDRREPGIVPRGYYSSVLHLSSVLLSKFAKGYYNDI